MASMQESADDDIIAQINIIPFVDIVLVLLIIFMLTSTAIVRASIEVDLPRAASAGSSVAETLNLVYTKDGDLYLNGQATTHDGVAAFIATTLPSTPRLQAVISADKRVGYGDVVTLIDLVRQNGVKTFALNIERSMPPEGQDP